MEKITHFRRCHVCGAVTEQKQKIDRCQSCGKAIVPFLYYDDSLVGPLSETQSREQLELKQLGTIRPIRGLTAYW